MYLNSHTYREGKLYHTCIRIHLLWYIRPGGCGDVGSGPTVGCGVGGVGVDVPKWHDIMHRRNGSVSIMQVRNTYHSIYVR